MCTIFGYTRVSSESQAESGLSLQEQEATVATRAKALAVQYELSIGGILSDPAVSATKHDLRDRPGGRKLDRLLEKGDHVVIAKLDRAFRNQRDCVLTMEAWEKRGVTAHLLDLGIDTSTPAGKLVTGIMSAFAQWESARIGERIRDAKKSMRARGRSTNGFRRLGYMIDDAGNLRPYKHERDLAHQLRDWRSTGWSLREIAEELNRREVRRPGRIEGQRTGAWSPQACARLLEALASKWP
jgi:DNA invertase Pin-like site-specific DNA recombinase